MSASLPRHSGLYRIVCSANGKYYVGQASNLKQRKAEHWSRLKLQKHGNSHLQNVVDGQKILFASHSDAATFFNCHKSSVSVKVDTDKVSNNLDSPLYGWKFNTYIEAEE